MTEPNTRPAASAAPNAEDAGLDVATLDAWIAERLTGCDTPRVAVRPGATTGIANALFLLTRGEHRWVFPAGVADGDNAMAELDPRLLRGAADFARGERR